MPAVPAVPRLPRLPPSQCQPAVQSAGRPVGVEGAYSSRRTTKSPLPPPRSFAPRPGPALPRPRKCLYTQRASSSPRPLGAARWRGRSPTVKHLPGRRTPGLPSPQAATAAPSSAKQRQAALARSRFPCKNWGNGSHLRTAAESPPPGRSGQESRPRLRGRGGLRERGRLRPQRLPGLGALPAALDRQRLSRG